MKTGFRSNGQRREPSLCTDIHVSIQTDTSLFIILPEAFTPVRKVDRKMTTLYAVIQVPEQSEIFLVSSEGFEQGSQGVLFTL